MDNTNDIPSEEQTGRLQQPAVGGSVCRITHAQAESIYMIKEDIKAMIGGGDDDTEWKRNVRNIERFLKANGFNF